jgi:hypothetical protein
MAAGENRNRAGLQTGAVCSRIDAACETGNDGKSCSAEISRHSIGEFYPCGGRVAGSHDRDLWPCEDIKLSMYADQWRGIVDHLQA